MKKLTQLLIVIMVISMATVSFAQNIGIKAGLNLSTMQYEMGYINLGKEFKMTPGIHLGAIVDIPFSNIFSLETGLLASTKGFRFNSDNFVDYIDYEYETKMVTNILYAEIPLTPKLSIPVGGIRIFGLAGPYVGVGIIGNTRTTYTEDGETETEDEEIEWSDEKDSNQLKRLDYGLAFGAGVEIKSFQFGVNYNLGLASLVDSSDEDFLIRNRVLAISFGYKFGQKQ